MLRLLIPAGVTLSRSEGSVALGVEMLRCAQHDSIDMLSAVANCERSASYHLLCPS